MTFVPMTIGEYYRHEGEVKGKVEGKVEGIIEGEVKGEVKGKIELLKSLYEQDLLTKSQYNSRLKPLKKEWEKIQHEYAKVDLQAGEKVAAFANNVHCSHCFANY